MINPNRFFLEFTKQVRFLHHKSNMFRFWKSCEQYLCLTSQTCWWRNKLLCIYVRLLPVIDRVVQTTGRTGYESGYIWSCKVKIQSVTYLTSSDLIKTLSLIPASSRTPWLALLGSATVMFSYPCLFKPSATLFPIWPPPTTKIFDFCENRLTALKNIFYENIFRNFHLTKKLGEENWKKLKLINNFR